MSLGKVKNKPFDIQGDDFMNISTSFEGQESMFCSSVLTMIFKQRISKHLSKSNSPSHLALWIAYINIFPSGIKPTCPWRFKHMEKG